MLRLFIFASGTLGGRFKCKYTGKTDWDEDKAPFGPSPQLLLLALNGSIQLSARPALSKIMFGNSVHGVA